ncbi:hypothetical protein [Flavobacterium turcicum]|uniref:Beta-carotene 15,15'-monooxygenase n=1 Tax=Flavobacterium turcicum TaxID=2764718 RepID=A0ABR7JJ05_9FLAO|nr:hypothetical protein [Flavobacterium turcicum]MBC5864481.1 hypothetical protein [Flavobacterium turcicum]NHL03249.1 hypothetical protein [Flavobacterium turcicum]
MKLNIDLKQLNWFIAISFPGLIIISSFLVTQTDKFRINTELLSNAILFDILIIAPFLYFLVIRQGTANKASVFRIFSLCLLASGLILDNTNTSLLYYIQTFVYPLIELSIIIWMSRSFYLARLEAKLQYQNTDFLSFSRVVLNKVIGNEKASNFFASEIAAIYYTFNWERTTKADDKKTFSVYKESGLIALLYVLMFVICIETAATHVLIAGWNETFAWVATGLSLYSCLQLFAHIRALKIRHIELLQNEVKIYNGLAAEVVISYENIERLELTNKLPTDKKFVKTALLNNLEEHNCILHLKTPVSIIKFFGIKKNADTILFRIDNSQFFFNLITIKKMNSELPTLAQASRS